jgi:hypothetical protein
VYYYGIENVTESRLSIGAREVKRGTEERPALEALGCLGQVAADFGGGWEPHELSSEGRDAIYGAYPKGPTFLGSVRAQVGRLVVFPNVLEHRVAGCRKSLVIFLVDPALTVLSTSYVPPQQLHWAESGSFIDHVQRRLPPEIADEVFKSVPCPYDIRVARKIRDEVRRERTTLAGKRKRPRKRRQLAAS